MTVANGAQNGGRARRRQTKKDDAGAFSIAPDAAQWGRQWREIRKIARAAGRNFTGEHERYPETIAGLREKIG